MSDDLVARLHKAIDDQLFDREAMEQAARKIQRDAKKVAEFDRLREALPAACVRAEQAEAKLEESELFRIAEVKLREQAEARLAAARAYCEERSPDALADAATQNVLALLDGEPQKETT